MGDRIDEFLRLENRHERQLWRLFLSTEIMPLQSSSGLGSTEVYVQPVAFDVLHRNRSVVMVWQGDL